MMAFNHEAEEFRNDYLASSSTAELAQVICEYLSKHQIELAGSLRISLEDTGTNLARLSVVGEFNRGDRSCLHSAARPIHGNGPMPSHNNVLHSAWEELNLKSTASPAHAAIESNATFGDFNPYISPYQQTCDDAVLTALLAQMPHTPPYFDDIAMEDNVLSSDTCIAEALGDAARDGNAFNLNDISWTGEGFHQSPLIDGDFPNHGTNNTAASNSQMREVQTPKRKQSTTSSLSTGAVSSLSTGAVSSRAQKLAQIAVRGNVCEFLEIELPRWIAHGLWRQDSSSSSEDYYSGHQSRESVASDAYYADLERAYSAVVRLDSRMGDDLIRNRVALIQLHVEYTRIYAECRSARSFEGESSVGRGAASGVIDAILSSIHEEWDSLDRKHQAALRAKFHDRKKYGKRWHSLATGLGAGILLLSSSKLAVAVRCTTDSARVLNDAVEHVRISRPATAKIISTLSPLAECLVKNKGYTNFDAMEILHQVYELQQQSRMGE